MLKKLRIGNFKAFGAIQNIPIRPITLIYGANSSGKSSIIHSILLANHALFSNSASPLDVHKPRLSDSVDLGGFRQYIHQHETDDILSFGVDISLDDLPSDTRDFFDPSTRIHLDYEIGDSVSALHPRPPSVYNIHESPITLSFHLQLDNSLFLSTRLVFTDLLAEWHGLSSVDRILTARPSEGSYSLARNLYINSSHPFCVTLISHMLEAAVLPDTLNPDEFLLTQRYIEEAPKDNFLSYALLFKALQPLIQPSLQEMVNPLSKRTDSLRTAIASRDRTRILQAAVDLYLPTFFTELAEHIAVVMEDSFRNVSYLGPLRTYPPRQLFSHQISPANNRINLEAWEKLVTSPDICSQVNKWLSSDHLQTPYEVVIREWFDAESLRSRLDGYWQNKLKIHQARIEERSAKGPVTLSEISRYDLEDELAELEMKVQNLISDIDSLQSDISNYPDLDDEDDADDAELAKEDLLQQLSEMEEDLMITDHEITGVTADLEASEAKPEWELISDIIGGLTISHMHDLRLIDRKRGIEVSHRDIGIGISQVLPVLVESLTLKGILAIEQPELHLHPALQAELGDLFIQSALKHKVEPNDNNAANSLILETHSEHLLLRIMRRMRDTYNGTLPEGMPPISPDDVALLFVEPGQNGSGSVVRHLQLAEDGELLDPWPGGFFEEGYKERFS